MNPEIIDTERGLALDVTISLPHGLHSRPSARLAQAARQYAADILLINQEAEVDAKSMLDVLSLALKKNDNVRILAKGPGSRDALLELRKILIDAGE